MADKDNQLRFTKGNYKCGIGRRNVKNSKDSKAAFDNKPSRGRILVFLQTFSDRDRQERKTQEIYG